MIFADWGCGQCGGGEELFTGSVPAGILHTAMHAEQDVRLCCNFRGHTTYC